jgi:hypothetical protein
LISTQGRGKRRPYGVVTIGRSRHSMAIWR